MPADPDRRAVLRSAALGATAIATGGAPASAASAAPDPGNRFPDGFLWGTATSAFQVEGAVREDGRGPSIWDTYVRIPGMIRDGTDADVAADHYRRYREDVALMKDLGVAAYRFSIAWPRVFPAGDGAPNPKGLGFYDRLVDTLLQAGIVPYPTLYHWDLPQALQDRGGWLSRGTAHALADYAGHVAARLGDRVRDFFTINEFHSFVELSHPVVDPAAEGRPAPPGLAPGLRVTRRELHQIRHHAVLAHGLSVQAIRAATRSGTRVGPADNPGVAVPVVETPEHVRASERATRDINAGYLGVILEGRYADAYLARAGADAPRFTDDDLRAISSPIDFIGLNVYRPAFYAEATAEPPGWRELPFGATHPRMQSGWHLLAPEVTYWTMRHVNALWRPKALYLAEAGCGAADVVGPDGRVHDVDRVMYLRAHLAQLRRATAEGLPVKGWFHWSLLDNFEWTDGYATRFGMVHVDFATQRRTPKSSAAWFAEGARRNAVV